MANNQQELQEKTEHGLTSAQPNTLYVPDVDVFETDENIVILAAMPGQKTVKRVTHAQYFLGMDINIGRLALKTTQRLMNHNPGMW